MSKEDLRLEEKVYLKFEEKIRNLVRALRSFGIRTIWCCEGHIRTLSCYTGILPWPWVVIQASPEAIKKLEEILREWNRLNPNSEWILSERRIHGSLTPSYIRRVMMPEIPGTFVRALVPAEENLSLSAQILEGLQKSSNELANFLSGR